MLGLGMYSVGFGEYTDFHPSVRSFWAPFDDHRTDTESVDEKDTVPRPDHP